MVSLLPRMTLTAGVAVSKSLGTRKMAHGGWSPATNDSSRDTQRYGGQRRDALMRRRRGGEWRRWDGGGELGSCGGGGGELGETGVSASPPYDLEL